MILEVDNSIVNITEENKKLELYTDTFNDFSFAELKDELEENRIFSSITPKHLQDKIIGPRIISAYKKPETEKGRTGGYNILLMGYASSPFRDFETYLRTFVGLDEDVIRLLLKQKISNFNTYEIPPGMHSIKDISEVVYTMGDQEETLKIEYDDRRMKTKIISTPFRWNFWSVKIYSKVFYNTKLSITPDWFYTPTDAIHVDSPGVYMSGKFKYNE